MNPRLRSVSFQPILHHNQTMWLLEDPLELSDQQLVLPFHIARTVADMDGTRSLDDLYATFCAEAGMRLPLDSLREVIGQLDEALLLRNERSERAIDRLRAEWLSQPFRPPAFAGASYPKAPSELDSYLSDFARADAELAQWNGWSGRAIIAPHIDYMRGGHIYSRVWRRAKRALEAADLIVIWGTDHQSAEPSITLSRLPYATPYGILPTDRALVDRLVESIGRAAAFEHELNHRSEHSIELAAVWLHYLRRESCPVLPILVGSFNDFTPDGHPSDDQRLVDFMQTLKALTAGRNVFSVASVDLAHVGPAFDSNYLMDDRRRQQLAQSDRQLMEAIARGEQQSFYKQLARTRNDNNVCGFSPTYMMLDYLGETGGQIVGYDQCDADRQGTSVVSIGGILLD